ncbi:MAG TPA: glycosyltransferase family 2 protein [Burkholderiales bacterium]|nr:glycosyltransferase family 2 protein [Burkholderiales bacterium]
MSSAPSVAVIIPCYNEAAAIARVVRDFRAALPCADVVVYDNNSRDDTARLAREAGAQVFAEPLQGKGHVIRRMFADVDADVYVLVDGDDTYDAAAAPAMVDKLLAERLDLVNGRRRETDAQNWRRGHRWGNRVLTGMAKRLFGDRLDDMLSGYKIFSRRYVKSFPALSTGFEIETELTIHALEMNMPIAEVDTAYRNRPEGSVSKLNTFRDGLRIVAMIARLLKEVRPLAFFSTIAALLGAAALFLAVPLATEYLETGLVPRLPTAVLVTGMMIVAALSFTCGVLLDSVARSRREIKRLHYLGIPLVFRPPT